MILIVDYGMGNLMSVAKAFERAGADVKVSGAPEDLDRADKVVVPGVGAFGDAVKGLSRRNLLNPIKEAIEQGKIYLGICLGLQLLFSRSYEGGLFKGLDIIKGEVRRFPRYGLKVPHIGWNQVEFSIQRKDCVLLKGIPDASFFYFVHSYYAAPLNKEMIMARTEYGERFASFIWKDNIYGVQFHPEKSQELGLAFIRNFVEL